MGSGDTVVAQSTPYGYGGIGIVRMTGVDSLNILGKLANLTKKELKTFKPRYAHKNIIFDENSVDFDEAIVTFYRGPYSYTGEDMLEISCHGSPYILKYVVDLCINYGASPASPGEFTRRAFINGKIDLIQAESVAGVVSSPSHQGINLAVSALRGKLSANISSLRDDIVGILGYSEHLLDVSHEDLTDKNISYIVERVEKIKGNLEILLKNYSTCRIMTSGALVVLAGPVNSGKSTLFNRLVGSDRSIVNPVPGTTRNLIEAQIIIEGVPITLVDTAGLRVALEGVEIEGVRRAKDYIKKADYVYLVLDVTGDYKRTYVDNNKLLKEIRSATIFNKIDLKTNGDISKYKQDYKKGLFMSALNNVGVKKLKNHIIKSLDLENSNGKSFGITTPRQYKAISISEAAVGSVTKILRQPPIQLELVSFELQNALSGIEDLLGVKTADDILNTMFEGFCVGK